jgi:hypothetical protein
MPATIPEPGTVMVTGEDEIMGGLIPGVAFIVGMEHLCHVPLGIEAHSLSSF